MFTNYSRASITFLDSKTLSGLNTSRLSTEIDNKTIAGIRRLRSTSLLIRVIWSNVDYDFPIIGLHCEMIQFKPSHMIIDS